MANQTQLTTPAALPRGKQARSYGVRHSNQTGSQPQPRDVSKINGEASTIGGLATL